MKIPAGPSACCAACQTRAGRFRDRATFWTVPEPELIDAELSLLAFQHRVLALASDPSIPLLERFRFLGIVTSNLDELYMVRMAELRGAAIDERAGQRAPLSFHEVHGGSAVARLEAIEQLVAQLLREQTDCAAACCREA